MIGEVDPSKRKYTAANLGQIAYDAFSNRAGKLAPDVTAPPWEDLSSVLKLAWIAGALAVWRVNNAVKKI